MNVQLIVSLFITIFAEIIMFMVVNTTLGGFLVPAFKSLASSNPTVFTSFTAHYEYILVELYIALAIVMLIPFVYLFVRTLKKEQTPEQQYYGGGSW